MSTVESKTSAWTLDTLMDRMLDDATFLWPRISARMPAPVDVSEEDGTYRLDVAVPGFDQKDIDIEVRGNVVTVRGKHVQRAERDDVRYYQRELRSGSFTRSIALPQDVDANEVRATLGKGVLTIRLAPSKPLASKKIEITTTS